VAIKDRNLPKGLAKVLPHLDIEIVKRSDQVSGFVVLPKRWIVERTIAWLNRCRRLAKDWENLTEKRSRSCASPQSASCSENYAIQPEVSGRTLIASPTFLPVLSVSPLSFLHL